MRTFLGALEVRMTELPTFISGLLIGATAIFFLKRDEIQRLTAQAKLLTDLLNQRLGYREPVEKEVPIADPVQAEIVQLEKKAIHSDDGPPDLLARQEDARRLTELKTRQETQALLDMATNSAKPPQFQSVTPIASARD